MNAPFLPELHNSRRRALEVEFFTERYHRAFDEEAALLAALASLVGAAALATTLEKVCGLIASHEQLQEQRLFPSYARGASIEAGLFDAWMSDSASIAEATAALRNACCSSSSTRLCSRVIHFAFEIDRHLVDEVEVFSDWAGRA
jgi:hypothetical protein